MRPLAYGLLAQINSIPSSESTWSNWVTPVVVEPPLLTLKMPCYHQYEQVLRGSHAGIWVDERWAAT